MFTKMEEEALGGPVATCYRKGGVGGGWVETTKWRFREQKRVVSRFQLDKFFWGRSRNNKRCDKMKPA